MNLRLKQIRTARGLSQKEMADRVNMPVRRYGSYERQERSLSLEDACVIADALDCTLDELAGREWRETYTDKRQDDINAAYLRMDGTGRDALHKVALSLGPERDSVPEPAEVV